MCYEAPFFYLSGLVYTDLPKPTVEIKHRDDLGIGIGLCVKYILTYEVLESLTAFSL